MDRRPAVWILFLGLGMAAGCDRSPSGPPASPLPPPATVAATRQPATQELLSGVYKKMSLVGMPVSVRVPETWKIEITNGLAFLQGSTPSDQAMIQISQRDPVPADRFDAVLERLQKNDDPQSGPPDHVNLRQVGKLQVLERISTGKPIPIAEVDPQGAIIFDSQGNPAVIKTTPLHWLITIFIPDTNSVAWYELNCIGLTAEQYALDKPLLEKIFNSIIYDDGTGPATVIP